jgi:hypothetical protein
MHRPQLARDDARGHGEAATDRGIESLADDIDLAVVEMPIGHHPWVAGEELPQQRNQEVAAEGLAHADFQGARGNFIDTGAGSHRHLQ